MTQAIVRKTIMKSIDELSHAWSSMDENRMAFIVIETSHPLNFHIGYAAPKQKCFVVENTGEIENIVSSKGIAVRCMPISNGIGLQFVLLTPQLEDLFVKLCWNLIDASNGPSEGAVDRLVMEYRNWQRLLQQERPHILTSMQQKGLIAELLFLSELIDRVGSNSALQSWTGPEGSDQDFDFPQYWAEIKATSLASDKVQISSLQQLDRCDSGVLAVYRMDKTTAHGIHSLTLEEAINTVKAKISSQHERDVFECKLLKHGILSGHYQRSSDRFKVLKKLLYNVTSDFPKLTPGNTPAGVVEAKYSISLASIASFLNEEVDL